MLLFIVLFLILFPTLQLLIKDYGTSLCISLIWSGVSVVILTVGVAPHSRAMTSTDSVETKYFLTQHADSSYLTVNSELKRGSSREIETEYHYMYTDDGALKENILTEDRLTVHATESPSDVPYIVETHTTYIPTELVELILFRYNPLVEGLNDKTYTYRVHIHASQISHAKIVNN